MEKIIIHTDGGARGNPGPAGAGAVIEREGKMLKEVSDYLGHTTNNVAEYEALIRILKAAVELLGPQLGELEVEVKMDSELIVRQMTGIYKVKHPLLKEKFAEVVQLRRDFFPHLMFTHVRREENKHADRLVNEAIDRGIAKE